MKKILLHLTEHLLLGLAVAGFSWWLTGSFWWTIVGIVVNVFMDLDHVLEYLVWARRFRLREFLLGRYFREKGTIMVIFHGWEYVVLALIYWLISGALGGLVVAVAMGTHLLFDQLSWDLSPWAYFISYRLKNKFAINKICRD